MSTATISLDQTDEAAIPAGAPEELAGPPHIAPAEPAPVTKDERISSVDVLRGVAIMGILIMNITDFGLGFSNYFEPLSTIKPVFNGPHWQANTILWFARFILAEGKMRGLLSLLFGAGVILMTSRAEARGAGVRTADIYTRRNMWLVLFGMIHCYFIWGGDILYFYAVAALIFLFPLRHLKPKTLLWIGAIVLTLNTLTVNAGQALGGVYAAHKSYLKADAAYRAHKPLTDEQKSAIENWLKSEHQFRKSPKDIAKDVEKHHGWVKNFQSEAKNAFEGETQGAYAGWGDWMGMMCLGMALFKNGFLTGKLRTRSYVLFAVICLGISWTYTFVACWHIWKGGFDQVQTALWMVAPYDIGRVGGALGNAALIILLLRAGVFKWLFARIANVGQMALSNYLLTSITMQFLFIWGPTHWYLYVDYYKLYIIAACMWTFNLIFSTLWLRRFRFGPFEWGWRSLTYWKRQPMRI